MFDTAYINTALTFVIDEHRQTTTISGSFFRTGKYQMDICVAVGDETFHTVQQPASVFFAVSCFQHHCLKVGTGIRFGEVHRHRFALAYARDETAVLVGITEFIQCFDTVLQRPDVSETCIGSGNDFSTHGVRSDREVQTTETAGHCHSVQSGFHHRVQIFFRTGSVFHPSVGTVRTFFVNAFSVCIDNFACYFSGDLQYFIVRVECILKIQRSVVEFIFISVVAFFEFANTFHHRIVQVILEFRYFCVKICHLSLLAILFIILNHLRHNFFDGSVDYVVGNRIDRSIRIVVDRDDDTTFLHTGDMLDLS